jgi:amidase
MVEARIAELAAALAEGHTNSVELTAKHLVRIAKYDRRSITLNAIPVINANAFGTAQASDHRRASSNVPNALDGIP